MTGKTGSQSNFTLVPESQLSTTAGGDVNLGMSREEPQKVWWVPRKGWRWNPALHLNVKIMLGAQSHCQYHINSWYAQASGCWFPNTPPQKKYTCTVFFLSSQGSSLVTVDVTRFHGPHRGTISTLGKSSHFWSRNFACSCLLWIPRVNDWVWGNFMDFLSSNMDEFYKQSSTTWILHDTNKSGVWVDGY